MRLPCASLVVVLLLGCVGSTRNPNAFFRRVDYPRWQLLGVDSTYLESALSTVDSMSDFYDDAWVQRWLDEGNRRQHIAEQLEAASDPGAGKAWADAARYFIVAHYPNPKTSLKREGFERSINAATKAMALGGMPFTPIDFDAPMGRLHITRSTPTDAVKKPVILVSGGLDGYKEELGLLLQGSLSSLADGVILVLVDMPGTGQNPRPLSVKGHEEYAAILDRLALEPDVDTERIGFMGLSFGGYWAVRLEEVEPRIKAAVNFGGPMTRAFTLGNFGKLPDAFVQAALAVTGSSNVFSLAGTSGALADAVSADLKNAKRPLLTINGTEDSVIPWEDTMFPITAGGPREFFLVPGDDHCAMGNLELVLKVAKRWLVEQLNATR